MKGTGVGLSPPHLTRTQALNTPKHQLLPIKAGTSTQAKHRPWPHTHAPKLTNHLTDPTPSTPSVHIQAKQRKARPFHTIHSQTPVLIHRDAQPLHLPQRRAPVHTRQSAIRGEKAKV